MVDRPRKSQRPAGGGRNKKAAAGGAERKGRRSSPGGRPQIDRRALERLEAEGLLTKEGKAALKGGTDTLGKPRERHQRLRVPQPKGSPGRQLGEAEALVAERLHKVMAQAGVASRRHSEELIQAGRVTVNGKVVTQLGTKVVPGRDIIEVDGRPLGKPEEVIYVMLNKPKGYVTTLYDPQGRPKVTDLLGDEVAQRVYPVGRLDYDTEGLLLLTNDGRLANALMHPARQVKKTYIAKVRGVPGPSKLRQLEKGIELEDGPTAPAEVKLVEVHGPNSAVLSIRIHEGRNRQVRRMCAAIGHEVIHLRRTTLGPLHLKDLPLGQWRELTEREVAELKAAAGLGPTKAERVAAIVKQRQGRVPQDRGAQQSGGSQSRGAQQNRGPQSRGAQQSRRFQSRGPRRSKPVRS